MEQAVGRRELLLGAGAATGGLLAVGVGLAAPAAADDDDSRDDEGLYGSWLVTRRDSSDPKDTAQLVASFAAGHVIISHEILPAGPPFTGTWDSNGDLFRATFWSGFPGPGGPGTAGGTAKVQIRGERDDDTLAGTYRVQGFDATGAAVPAETATGSFSGTRIEA